jgi:hypothetical protein
MGKSLLTRITEANEYRDILARAVSVRAAFAFGDWPPSPFSWKGVHWTSAPLPLPPVQTITISTTDGGQTWELR